MRSTGSGAGVSCTPASVHARTWTAQRYPGTCAEKNLPEAPGLSLARSGSSPPSNASTTSASARRHSSPSAQCGDLLARDREGNWTYQFAVAVDDLEQGVNLVVRGEDLLDSTGRQIQLARLLGRAEPPRFLHHALLMKSPAQKLSKSDGDTGVRDLRTRGLTPAQVSSRADSRL